MNKKIGILFICLISLFLISAVSANDNFESNSANASEGNTIYQITSGLSNEDIQYMFDNSMDGDTFEFTSKEYKNISLVVDKKLNIVSIENSVVYASNQVSDKARSLGITDTFGFYFTSKSSGSLLSGITIIATNCDYGVVIDSSDNTTIENNRVNGGKNSVLV